MLGEFASKCDSAATHMKAAALPRQQTHVILPLPNLKENECYAPGYRDGEEVILVRFPHSGLFEIPRLVVNNRSRIGKQIIGNDAPDAIGIHPKAAAQLSGADFDGDTVLVIPTKGHNLESTKAFQELVDFDPKTAYPTTEEDRKSGRVKWIKTKRQRGTEMGKITNLITDMQVYGDPSPEELVRAVKHSMVVVDAYKHKLDYKQSERDNGIAELRAKYQPPSAEKLAENPNAQPGGAKTIFSRAKADTRVDKRKGGPITDPETGELSWRTDTDARQYKLITKTVTDENGEKVKVPVLDEQGRKTYEDVGQAQQKVPRMTTVRDAYELTSGGSKDAPMPTKERIYAEYANHMKALANRARKEAISIPTPEWNREAERVYKKEVEELKKKVNANLQRAPLERKARAAAQAEMRAVRDENPDIEQEDFKKLESQKLKRMRALYGADKATFRITPREWEAIQSGAIPKTRQLEIFRFCDQDQLKELASPREQTSMSRSDVARAKALLKQGYYLSEVADILGVSVSTITKKVGEQETE
jgi:hypothetical protein